MDMQSGYAMLMATQQQFLQNLYAAQAYGMNSAAVSGSYRVSPNPAPPGVYAANPFGSGLAGTAAMMGMQFAGTALGYQPIGYGPANYYDRMQSRQFYNNQSLLQQRMAGFDAQNMTRAMEGIYNLSGMQWTPQTQRGYESVFGKVTPWFGMLPEHLRESLGGRYGSALNFGNNLGGIASTFSDAGTGTRISGGQPQSFVENLYRQQYNAGAVRQQPLTAGQYSGAMAEAASRGYLGDIRIRQEDLTRDSNMWATMDEVSRRTNQSFRRVNFEEDGQLQLFVDVVHAKEKKRQGLALSPEEERVLEVSGDQFEHLKNWDRQSQKQRDRNYRLAETFEAELRNRNNRDDTAAGRDEARRMSNWYRQEADLRYGEVETEAAYGDLSEKSANTVRRLVSTEAGRKLLLRAQKLARDPDTTEKDKEEFAYEMQAFAPDVGISSREEIDNLTKELNANGNVIAGAVQAKKAGENFRSLAGATQAGREVLHGMGVTDASAGQIMDLLEDFAGGNLRNVDPKQVEQDLRRLQEISRVTGVGLGQLVENVRNMSRDLRAKGIDPTLASSIVSMGSAGMTALNQSGFQGTPYGPSNEEIIQGSEQQVRHNLESRQANAAGAAKRLTDSLSAGEKQAMGYESSEMKAALDAETRGETTYMWNGREELVPRTAAEWQRTMAPLKDKGLRTDLYNTLLKDTKANRYRQSQDLDGVTAEKRRQRNLDQATQRNFRLSSAYSTLYKDLRAQGLSQAEVEEWLGTDKIQGKVLDILQNGYGGETGDAALTAASGGKFTGQMALAALDTVRAANRTAGGSGELTDESRKMREDTLRKEREGRVEAELADAFKEFGLGEGGIATLMSNLQNATSGDNLVNVLAGAAGFEAVNSETGNKIVKELQDARNDYEKTLTGFEENKAGKDKKWIGGQETVLEEKKKRMREAAKRAAVVAKNARNGITLEQTIDTRRVDAKVRQLMTTGRADEHDQEFLDSLGYQDWLENGEDVYRAGTGIMAWAESQETRQARQDRNVRTFLASRDGVEQQLRDNYSKDSAYWRATTEEEKKTHIDNEAKGLVQVKDERGSVTWKDLKEVEAADTSTLRNRELSRAVDGQGTRLQVESVTLQTDTININGRPVLTGATGSASVQNTSTPNGT
jgi:hypothetical protein